MTIASGTRVSLAYVEEVTRGVTPAGPTLKTLRATQRAPNLEKTIFESREVRPTRQRSDVRHGFNQVAGAVGYELSRESYDDFLRYALGGTWDAIATAAVSINVDDTAKTFTRASGSFVTDGFREGYIVVGANFANAGNNSPNRYTVSAVTATILTVLDPDNTLVTEIGTGDETITMEGKTLSVGLNLLTVSLERQFDDITQYQIFRGVAVQQMQLAITTEAIISGTFQLIGMSSPALSGSSVSGSAPTAAPTSSPFDAFNGAMFEAESGLALATSMNFTLNNQRRLQAVIGSKFSPDVFEGTAIITGDISMLLEDAVIFNKFVNETETSIWFRLDDPNGTDFMNIVFPRVKYTGASMDPEQEGPVSMEMPFHALEHGTYGTSMWIQRSNA